MSFLHPELAWATAAAAAIPLAIHLLNRRRYRREPWAAMTLLLAAHRRSRRRVTLEQWTLLAVRTAVILLLGLAVSRPQVEASALVRVVGAPRRAHVIIVDDTLSMHARRRDGTTAFEAAKQAAMTLIDRLDAGDRIAVFAASRAAHAPPAAASFDHDAARRTIAFLSCSYRAGGLRPAISAAGDVLAECDAQTGHRIVYVVTDLARNIVGEGPGGDSRSDFAPEPSAGLEEAGSHSAAKPASIDRIYFVDVGPEDRRNVAVADLAVVGAVAVPGVPMTVRVTIRNHADAPSDAVSVQLLVDGEVARTARLDRIPPETAIAHDFRLAFDRDGSYRVSARLRADAGNQLAVDDERFLALRVSGEVRALGVEGRPHERRADRALFYYAAAVSPGQGAAGGPRIGMTMTAPADLDAHVLDDYDLVVLGDVRRLPEASWERLTRFVRDGGGLLAILGEHASAERVNEASSSAGRDALVPVQLVDWARSSSDAESARPRVADPLHPAVVDFQGHDRGGLSAANVYGWWRTKADASLPPARTLLALSNGDPLVLEHAVGSGRAVTILTGLDMGCANLPAKPDFVPLALNLSTHAARDANGARNLRVGEPFVRNVAAAHARTTAVITRPDGRPARVPVDLTRDPPAVVHANNDVPGFYSVGLGPRRDDFAVNVAPEDGDLARLDDAALRRAFGADAQCIDLSNAGSAPTALNAGGEFATLFLTALFAMVVAETMLAAWFGQRR